MSVSREHSSWVAMKSRCNSANNKDFHRYGGRGISYSPTWENFSAFFADMGERPEGTSLDRIDNEGNYTKENCKWSNDIEQATNRSSSSFFLWQGLKRTAADLQREYSISSETIRARIKRGWTLERALTTPPDPRHWALEKREPK